MDISKARARAEHMGLEVLTPQTAAQLFGVGLTAVRAARLGGHVNVAFSLNIGGRAVHMLGLNSARRYWSAQGKTPSEEEIDAMRDNSTVLGMGRPLPGRMDDTPAIVYSVLSLTPLIEVQGDEGKAELPPRSRHTAPGATPGVRKDTDQLRV